MLERSRQTCELSSCRHALHIPNARAVLLKPNLHDALLQLLSRFVAPVKREALLCHCRCHTLFEEISK